jgi:FMN phosphatase YigB (HAD superfamily)
LEPRDDLGPTARKQVPVTAAEPSDVVFLFDVDNTLLDNDQVTRDLRDHLAHEYGEEVRDRYFAIFEDVRTEIGYADYLGALQRYRLEDMRDPRVLKLSSWLLDYPFAQRLYPGALEVVARVVRLAPAVVLSDGDAVFQPLKVERSGLWRAFAGNVLIYVHKEAELENVERLFLARRYVMVDDKVRILTAIKEAWGPRVTTVFIRQGHYALDAGTVASYPSPDVALERIDCLLEENVLAHLMGHT